MRSMASSLSNGGPAPLPLRSVADTERLARRIAAILRAGDVLMLEGDLGAGKTTLVQGMGRYWGVDPGVIRSPTFALVNIVELADFDLVHADLYRMRSAAEVINTGLAELLMAPDCVCVVEWPALASGLLDANALGLTLSMDPASGARVASPNQMLRQRLRA